MDRGTIGFFVLAGVVLLLVTHGRPAPKIDKAAPAELGIPRFHVWRGESDADRSLDIKDAKGGPRARILERDGMFYDPDGSPIRTIVTPDLYFGKFHYDLGAFAGFRPASRGYPDLNPLTAGLRFSPCRLGYDTIAPDLVITNDWAGAGASFYLPEHLAGPDWKHFGLGAWYGYPFRGRSDAPGGWAVGASFSIR
jgi:hypothetical protein